MKKFGKEPRLTAGRCSTGKKKYTRTQAKAAARFLKYNKKFPGFVPNTYKCKVCGHWHVGNTSDDYMA